MKVVRVEAWHVVYPFRGFFKFLTGRGHHVLTVALTAEDGTVGWGQSPFPTRWSYESAEVALVVVARHYGPAVLGCNPLEIDSINQKLDQVLAPGWTQGFPITRAAIDIALHDLAGKLLGQPVWRLFGREAPGPVRLSWTVNVSSLEEAEAVVEEGRQRGYRNFNLKVAPDVRFDVELARLVRSMAPEGFLWADANGGYDLHSAKEACRRLAEVGVDVLEQPLRPNMISGYRELRRLRALPILMDEGIITARDLLEVIRLEMVDGLAVKVPRSGGLSGARRQLELARDAGLLVLGSGLTDPEVSLAASLHLLGGYKIDFPAALNGPQFLAAEVLAKPLPQEGDQAFVPTGPGLGVEVSREKLACLIALTEPPLATSHVVLDLQ
ncbi:MAG: hypothetical protein NZ899_04130 [Thermoguttaceae bacterium]|nr:hypothetical protein [Thermoguttaceae bacterium]MDW8077677.1 enolase C-terminal domain-like protein [Thermoguttaceae bacterium]